MRPPQTVDEMLAEVYVLEAEFPKLQNVPYERAIIVSTAFVMDVCERLIALENKTKGANE